MSLLLSHKLLDNSSYICVTLPAATHICDFLPLFLLQVMASMLPYPAFYFLLNKAQATLNK